jgi:acyl-CoA thioesterase-1
LTFSFWLRLLTLGAALVAAPAGAAERPVVLVLGDSLSAAYGIPREEGWVHLLARRLEPRGYRVVNASISGDTSRGGLTRLDPLLKRHDPDWLLLELGANDGLRGIPTAETRRNLTAIIERAREAGARVVLLGIRLPVNYGPVYRERFEAVYRDLAAAHRLPLLPFLLDGVVDQLQEDGLHPRAEAQPRILGNVWGVLGPVLANAEASS